MEGYQRPLGIHIIMDERAYSDVDRAIILAVQSEDETLAEFRQERDRYWPGYPIVALDTWTIIL